MTIECSDLRDYAYDKRRTVDDRPYGGGPGMLMMVQPIRDAIYIAKSFMGQDVTVIYLSPQGRKLNQKGIFELLSKKKLILICGRYEGIDQRIIETEINEEWSIGDYVLTGGELAAMVMIDAISRFIPGVLGHKRSAEEDSFMTGLFAPPHYTRPKLLGNMAVPDVLLSGNHSKINRWRKKQSLGYTWLKRPQLLMNLKLTEEQKMLLLEFQKEYEGT